MRTPPPITARLNRAGVAITAAGRDETWDATGVNAYTGGGGRGGGGGETGGGGGGGDTGGGGGGGRRRHRRGRGARDRSGRPLRAGATGLREGELAGVRPAQAVAA